MLSVHLWLLVKPSVTSLSVLVLLDTEETLLIPTLAATKSSVKLTAIVLPTWLVTPRLKGASIHVQLSPVEKDLAGLKTINQSVIVNLVSNHPMDNVWTLMSVPNLALVIHLPFVEILLDPSLVLVQKAVLEMPEHQAANQEENVSMIEIVQQHLLVEKEDALILALVNVVLEPLVKSLVIRPSVLVQQEQEETQEQNVGNWNASKTQTVQSEDLVSRTNVWMLVVLTVSVASMPFVPS